MPNTFYGPYTERNSTYANAGNANLGRWPLGHILILPDHREYRFTLNDGTVEVAGNLYQGVAAVAGHTNIAADVVRAIGATALSATLNGTAPAADIYAEGVAHTNDEVGEAYAYRIRRAMTAGAAHASAASAAVLTVNLQAGESVQVALTTASEMTFTRNRYHQVTLHVGPPTALLSGVSPGVAALDRFYWSQVKGYTAVLADLTLLAGNRVMPSIAQDGRVEGFKRRVRTAGTSVIFLSNTAFWGIGVADADGTEVAGVYAIYSVISAAVAATYDVTGGIAYNGPDIGVCVKANASTEYALIDLNIV